MNDSNQSITIGITAYNEGEYLQEAWDSVINQTRTDWAAIMILDGDSDEKTEAIRIIVDNEDRLNLCLWNIPKIERMW